MKKKKYESAQEALHAILNDPKTMARMAKKLNADYDKKQKVTDKWKKKFDKMDDKTFTKFVQTVCKDYNENPYTKKEKPYKYVKEMWGIVDVMEKYGTEAESPDGEDKFGFGQGCFHYRGFHAILYVGQGSFWAICQDGERIGQTEC